MSNGYQNPLKNTTPRRVRGGLLLHGLTLRDFADRLGVPAVTVRVILHRYVGKNVDPAGDVTQRVLDEMAKHVNHYANAA
jgi:hypothetical protein